MPGKRIGYKRVSTEAQNPDSQLLGIELDKVFVEKESGYSAVNRYELHKLKEYVRDDDQVYVECMDRLGRNGKDLDDIVEYLLDKGVEIHFVREGIILGKKNDLMSKLSYDLLKSFIHFMSQLAKERQLIGIEKAKREGKYKGKVTKFTDKVENIIREGMSTRKSKGQIAREAGICRSSLYTYLAAIEKKDSSK